MKFSTVILQIMQCGQLLKVIIGESNIVERELIQQETITTAGSDDII